MKEIVMAKGLFSKLSITLNDNTIQQLALIKKKDNPLAQVEADLKATLQKFERVYFELSQPEPKQDQDVVPNNII
jgi:hypothetical protein